MLLVKNLACVRQLVEQGNTQKTVSVEWGRLRRSILTLCICIYAPTYVFCLAAAPALSVASSRSTALGQSENENDSNVIDFSLPFSSSSSSSSSCYSDEFQPTAKTRAKLVFTDQLTRFRENLLASLALSLPLPQLCSLRRALDDLTDSIVTCLHLRPAHYVTA